jgi:hypothetical protein
MSGRRDNDDGGEDEMTLGEALAVVEARVALVEETIKANERWLTMGFLADDAFTPEFYLLRAECQKELRRELAAIAAGLDGEHWAA